MTDRDKLRAAVMKLADAVHKGLNRLAKDGSDAAKLQEVMAMIDEAKQLANED